MNLIQIENKDMNDFELLMLNDSMKYVSLLISCLEPLFISAN